MFTKKTMIVINEILANPDGPDEGKEWIELWNNSDKTLPIGVITVQTEKNTKTIVVHEKPLLPNEIRITPLKQLPNTGANICINHDCIAYPQSPSGKSWQRLEECRKKSCSYHYEWSDPTPQSFSETITIKEINPDISKIPWNKNYSEIMTKNAVIEGKFQGESIQSLTLLERSPPHIEIESNYIFLLYGITFLTLIVSIVLQMNWETITKAAVSVRKMRFPKVTTSKPAASAASTSS